MKKFFMFGLFVFVVLISGCNLMIDNDGTPDVSSMLDNKIYTYGGTNSDYAHSVVNALGDSLVIAGSTYSYGSGGSDFYVVKVDANGNTIWSKTYGGTNDDYAYSVTKSLDGGFVVAGSTKSYGSGGSDFYVVKIDANGNTVWSKTYGGTNDDYAKSIITTSKGNLVIAGYTTSYGAGYTDFYVIKIDSDGNVIWSKTYGGTGFEWANSIVETSDGGFAIAGLTTSYGAGYSDFYIVKIDENGNMVWSKTYGGTKGDEATSIIKTSDGGFAVAGYTYSYGRGDTQGYSDICVMKLDVNGNTNWTKLYGGVFSDFATSIIETSDGGFAVAGYTASEGAGGFDFCVFKLGVSGGAIWSKTYGGAKEDRATSVVETSDHKLIVIGSTSLLDSVNSDFGIVKIK